MVKVHEEGGRGSMARGARVVEAGLAQQNSAALREAREADQVEPRAEGATYDPGHGLIVVQLRGGCAFGFPPRQVDGLQGATEDQLSAIRISPSGDGLHWDDLNVDASLTGLLARALNLKEWAPRIMGQVRSEAKARAARENGLKGGRPRGSFKPGGRKKGTGRT